MADTDERCVTCGKTVDETRLEKCSVCFKRFCSEHGYSMSGRRFCSHGCADYFFFEPEDD